ncbi:Gram-negative bacterial tonB protein [Hyella patelloides LEGE 07179]|uniref:Gram-negative bacterial tonB protein n=1 Tax=Hyella patelloides LEGE 07179 TaxID=945734 RepID=A0A563VIR6_9CYAN|nr:energy transducer TonB [Hyella patelloides]VEP11289.1 Gram-negative bacterial tonB protein [Hyella patelloides LEGE 07179]
MPYELEKNELSHKFLNTSQIAILLSLALHLLVYKYGFPTPLIKEKPNNGDKTVSTIQLSPVEQARLPNLEPDWNVPEFDNTPLDEAAPPFALPLPPGFTPSPNLPAIPIPPGSSVPNIPPVSFNMELPPLGITDLSALPLPPPLEDLDSITPPDVPLTNPEKPTEEPTEEPVIKEEPTTSTAPEPPPEPEKTEEAKPAPEEIAAVRQQKLEGNVRDVSLSLQQQDGETSDEEARKNYVAWLSKIEDVEPESREIEGIYPRDACIRRLEGKSVYGVLIDANDKVVGLELIKGAKYPIFNQQASQDIQKHEFTNDTQETQPYQVTVDYKYDPEICPSLTLPSLREKEKPATAPKPESETKTNPATETPPESEIETNPATAPKPEAEIETNPKTETPPEDEQQLPLRERLQNVPLQDDSTIRERLRNNPLPKPEQ